MAARTYDYLTTGFYRRASNLKPAFVYRNPDNSRMTAFTQGTYDRIQFPTVQHFFDRKWQKMFHYELEFECHVKQNGETKGIFFNYYHALLFFDVLKQDFIKRTAYPLTGETICEMILFVNGWGDLRLEDVCLTFDQRIHTLCYPPALPEPVIRVTA